jgi:forkhead protein FKH
MMEDEEMVAAIVPYLQMPAHEVQASKDHANSVYEKLNREGVQAYAKLAGRDWTYYVKSLRNIIGRPPEGQSSKNNTPELNGVPSENVDEDGVHVDLGPVKMVSRLHAEISFDTDDDAERWEILVHGRNGIRINGVPLRKGENHALISGEVIEVAGVEMMFVLPQEGRSLQVQKKYLARAGLIDPQAANDPEKHGGNTTSSAPSSSTQPRGQNGAGPLPIAPAPPDYRRPGTPVSARTNTKYIGKSPYVGGTMMMNADDVNLSLDSNHHIKPSYSYAQMITQAILDTEEEKLNLAGIYAFIQDKYAYYRHQVGGGWQVSFT